MYLTLISLYFTNFVFLVGLLGRLGIFTFLLAGAIVKVKNLNLAYLSSDNILKQRLHFLYTRKL